MRVSFRRRFRSYSERAGSWGGSRILSDLFVPVHHGRCIQNVTSEWEVSLLIRHPKSLNMAGCEPALALQQEIDVVANEPPTALCLQRAVVLLRTICHCTSGTTVSHPLNYFEELDSALFVGHSVALSDDDIFAFVRGWLRTTNASLTQSGLFWHSVVQGARLSNES